MTEGILFAGWTALIRAVVVGILAYIAIVVIFRISGKRTFASLNAFDFIVTVALGSTLATVLLSKDIALAEGVVGFITLVGLQFIVSFFSVRSKAIRGLVKNEPRLLYYRGALLDDAMKRERITDVEVMQALLAQGISSFDDVDGIVLETNGNLSIIQQVKPGTSSTLSNVRGLEKQE